MLAELSSSLVAEWISALKDRPKAKLDAIAKTVLRRKRSDSTVLPAGKLVWPQSDHNGLSSLYFGRDWKRKDIHAIKLWSMEARRLGFPELTLSRVKRTPAALACLLIPLLDVDAGSAGTVEGKKLDCGTRDVDDLAKGPFLGGPFWVWTVILPNLSNKQLLGKLRRLLESTFFHLQRFWFYWWLSRNVQRAFGIAFGPFWSRRV